jgi:isoquinoline 1-oxidoreductase alpha subunit
MSCAMIRLNINGTSHELDVDPEMPLLWAIRDAVGLTGTKYGCGRALCGACTVHIDGRAMRSCVIPVNAAQGKAITTIEGVDSAIGRAVLAAWRRLDVVQCGYCQSGQIMSATALLARTPRPSNSDIDSAMAGNICRCATYVRIRAAIKAAAEALG